MKQFMHKELAEGRWFQLSLMEQLGNIGSEVGRALHAQGKDGTGFTKRLSVLWIFLI